MEPKKHTTHQRQQLLDAFLVPKSAGSQRTRKRKRGLPKDDRDYEYNEEEEEATNPSKRRASEVVDYFVNGDIDSVILSFLDVRELFLLSFCNKTLLKSLRYEHVVRASLLHGGHAQRMMTTIYKLVKERKIYIPSPQRLLRLVNGRQCERDGCNRNMSYRRSEFGVCFCWECTKAATKKVSQNPKWLPLLENPRTANIPCNYESNFLWVTPYRDTAGERAGPILSMKDRVVVASHSLLRWRDADDPHMGDREEIMTAFESSQDAVEKREEEREQDHEQRVAEIDDRRRKQTREVISMLSRYLPNKEWKNVARSHHFVQVDLSRERLRIPLVGFECRLVQEAMEPLLKCLSKATPGALKEVAQGITTDFEMLCSKHFYNEFSFLSGKSKLQRALRAYCEEHFSNGELLKRMDQQTVRLIRNEYLLAGLHRAMGKFHKALGPFIVSSSSCQVEADLLVYANQAATALWKERMDLDFWAHDAVNEPDWVTNGWTDIEQCTRVYQECVVKFPHLYANMVTLLRSQELDNWIHSAGDAEEKVLFLQSDSLWDSFALSSLMRSLMRGDLQGAIRTAGSYYDRMRNV